MPRKPKPMTDELRTKVLAAGEHMLQAIERAGAGGFQEVDRSMREATHKLVPRGPKKKK
ncbi:hypothetical protein GCM10027048_27820 [Hymenobacter coalescens]